MMEIIKLKKNYFKNFSSREKDYVLEVVPGNETDPENLIKQTIKKSKNLGLDLADEDRVYCIFDADIKPSEDKQIINAIKLAKENNIIPIVSTPCIELWFLLHYDYTTAEITSDKVIARLKNIILNMKKNCNIYSEIKDKVDISISNSKKLEKFHLQNNRRLQMVRTNPYTEVYKLIEKLLQ